MAEDIRLAKGEEVDAIKAELARKVYTSTLASDGYLKKKITGKLPSLSAEFDFEDNTPVSMNMWGFTPDYFDYSEAYFKEFLSDPKNMENLKAEFFIPLMVNKLINEKTATVEVLDTTSKWFGVTYAADRDDVVARIQKLIDEGVYPNKLF